MWGVEVLVPIAICVVLPVLIVWIIGRVRQNEANRKAEVMLKALESGATIDPEYFKSPKVKKQKSVKQDLLEKLNGACITGLMGVAFLILSFLKVLKGNVATYLPFAGAVLLAVGIGLFVTYFAGKKMLAKEIEAEDKNLEQQE